MTLFASRSNMLNQAIGKFCLADFGKIAVSLGNTMSNNLKSDMLMGRMLPEAFYNLISKCLDLSLVWEVVLDFPIHVVIIIFEGPTSSAMTLVVYESICILFLMVSSAL